MVKAMVFCGLIGLWSLLFSKNEEPLIEKPIVVVVCSYNNGEWSKNTLESIFTQNYSNFRLIIVDDCSSDNNQEVIQQYIDDHDLADRITFVKNSERKRKLSNLYRVLYQCDDNEIVVMLDGDDWFAHPDVFALINKTYENDDIWFTYGQYRNVPASQAVAWGHKEMGYCRTVPKHIQKKHAYRYYSFVYMHLRTFRGWLFKLVKLEDLIAEKVEGFEGDFYPASNDVAMYFPMVEMAHTRIKFIPEIVYIRNLYSEIVGFKVDRKLQITSAREIRKKGCYPVVFRPQKNRLVPFEQAQADMMIVCKYGLSRIGSIIENAEKMMESLGTLFVFFKDTEENKVACRRLRLQYPQVTFVSYSTIGSKSLKNRILDCLSGSGQNHCIITTDSFSVMQPINISEAIYALEKTFAYRFYLNRNASQIASRHLILDDTLCAWKFAHSVHGWNGINSVNDMLLCRKDDLLRDMKGARFDTIYGLINTLYQNDSNKLKLGLFFKQPRVAVLP